MARYSKKLIQAEVNLLNELLDRPTEYHTKINGVWAANVGHLCLDHNTIYGGYQLQEVSNKLGALDDRAFGLSFGHRLKAAEMYLFLAGVIAGLEAK